MYLIILNNVKLFYNILWCHGHARTHRDTCARIKTPQHKFSYYTANKCDFFFLQNPWAEKFTTGVGGGGGIEFSKT
jgi:hypothetical protein